MYLELADGYGGLPETALMEQGNRESPFLFVPGGMIPGIDQDTYVNEAMFDHLPDLQWHAVMSILEPYQENNMGFWPFSTKKGRERRKERRDTRQKNKIERIQTRANVGGGIGGLIDKVTNVFSGGGTTVRPTSAEELEMIQGAQPQRPWMARNWPWLAGGAAVVLITAFAMRQARKRRK